MVYLPVFDQALFEADGSQWHDKAKLTILVNGLNNETKGRLETQREMPEKYDDFCRALLQLSSNAYQRRDARERHENNKNDNKGDEMDWQTVKHGRSRESQGSRERQGHSQGRRSPSPLKGEFICFNCGKKGHIARYCEKSRSPSPPTTTTRAKLTAIRQGHPSSGSDSSSDEERKKFQRYKSAWRAGLGY